MGHSLGFEVFSSGSWKPLPVLNMLMTKASGLVWGNQTLRIHTKLKPHQNTDGNSFTGACRDRSTESLVFKCRNHAQNKGIIATNYIKKGLQTNKCKFTFMHLLCMRIKGDTYYTAEKFEKSFRVLHGFREAGRSVSTSEGGMGISVFELWRPLKKNGTWRDARDGLCHTHSLHNTA